MNFTKKVILLLMVVLSLNTLSQTIGDYIDVVHLKNGNKVKGIIIEQTPGKSIKIKTKDQSELIFQISEIEKFEREEALKTENKIDSNKIKWINNYKIKDKGYFYEFDLYAGSKGSGFRFSNGIRLNKLKKIGLVLNYENQNRYSVTHYNKYYNTSLVGLNILYSQDILNKRITPFYELEAGFQHSLDEQRYYYYYQSNSNRYSSITIGGPTVGGSTGIKFNTTKKISYKVAIFHKAAIDFYRYKHYEETSEGEKHIGNYNSSSFFYMIGLRFGLEF